MRKHERSFIHLEKKAYIYKPSKIKKKKSIKGGGVTVFLHILKNEQSMTMFTMHVYNKYTQPPLSQLFHTQCKGIG